MGCQDRGEASDAVHTCRIWENSQEIEERPEVNIIRCNSRISSLSRGRRWREGLELWASLPQQGLRPDTWSLNAALGCAGCSAGSAGTSSSWPAVLALLAFASADTISFNLLLTSLAKDAFPAWKASMAVLALLPSAMLRPQAASLGPCISASSRATRWQQAAQVLRVFRVSSLVDLGACNAALAGCAGAGRWQQAFCKLEALLSSAMQPDAVTFNSCFSACETARVGQRALQLMQRMCMLGIRPTAISINTIVSACEKVSEWKTALGLLAELPEMGLLPDIISYNAAIGACSENWKQAVALFQNLLSTRLCPDQVTLGSLITACANAEQLPTIETLLEHMHQLCLEENLVICNSCLKACDKAEAWQSSLIFLDGMTCLQIQKDLLSYGSAMRACQKALHWQLACHLFDQSASSNLVPDAFSYEAAITAYAAAGRALQTVALLWGLSNVLRLQNLREKSQRIQETP
eukprot:s1684_g9.t1